MAPADRSPPPLAECPLPLRHGSWLQRHFPGLCALGRVLGWTLVTLYLLFALMLLALRHWVLPQIQDYRPQIERLLGRAIGLPVGIERLEARWEGLRPGLSIGELTIHDQQNRPALALEQVEAVLSWHTLWRLTPILYHLEIRSPELFIRRDAAGQLFIAGLPVGAAGGEDDFSDWLLAQEQIIIRDARIIWLDEQRGAPPLALEALNVRLENQGRRHRFGVTAQPPPELAARLDLRGDFRGRDLENLQTWQGRAFLELDYADLAIWRQWLDYPLELPRGRGALRLWADFADERLQGLTADVRLADVAMRLAPELPMLELRQLAGRLSVKLRGANGWRLEGRQLAFELGDHDLSQPATDLRCDYWPEKNGSRGEFAASHLDLATLAALATALPLDSGLRTRLQASAPQGTLSDLTFNWRQKAGEPLRWSIASRLTGLAWAPHDGLPGVALIDGELRGDQRTGRLWLHAAPFVLKLPTVFPQGGIAFDRFAGEVRWRHEADQWVVQWPRLEFANADLAGSAHGRWLSAAEGPGRLELEAKIPQLQGTAVWRYLPYAVNPDGREWLRQSLLAGVAEQVTLKLAGDLAHFPFHEARQGVFRVHGQLRDGRLRYAPDWPELIGVAGELTFEGVGMRLRADRGQILGTRIKEVLAEIPNLDTHTPWLKLTGKVSGEANEFLRFIAQSPVAERIDHFTAGMSATGSGELSLRLDMPLANVAETRIDGRFRFMGNRLTLADDLPPLVDTQGELMFTADKLEVKKARARFLGLPLSIEVVTQPGGIIKAKASGTLEVASLAAQWPHPVLQHLAGSAPLAVQLTVQKKAVDWRIESSLRGIASSLPEPFDKSAAAALPLVVERRSLGSGTVARERLNLTLGEVLAVQLQRRLDGQQAVVERGLIALGRAATSRLGELPDKGLRLSARVDQLDLDFWRRVLQEAHGGGSLPIDRLELRADALKLQGRRVHAVSLRGQREGERWRFELDSREAVGRIAWLPSGQGRLEARFSLLSIPEDEDEAVDGHAKVSPTGTAQQELPAVFLSAERFLLGTRELGALKVEGVNRDGAWLGQAELSNDEAELSAKGRWRPAPADFRMQFTLRTNSIEKLLGRLGLPNTVRRGSATLEGELRWAGGPMDFDLATMQGTLKLSAANGQFAKLEPGVGRLLGVLSLQALPRRITLDFRDIFSEGLVFDALEGQARIGNGRIATQDLAIRGPQARITISGEADLMHETQDLRVRVQPVIGDSVATGVMLMVNPAAGAAVWLADKLLQDPLGRALAWEFAVSGPWQEPKVDKIAAPRPAAEPGQ